MEDVIFIVLMVTLSTYCYNKSTWWRMASRCRQTRDFLTPWDLNNVRSFTDILKCVPRMKSSSLQFKSHHSLFLSVQQSLACYHKQYWIRKWLDTEQATNHYLYWCWSIQIYNAMRCHQRSLLVHVSNLIQIQCTSLIFHNAPFCSRNVHMCAHFCYKMVHCGTFVHTLRDLWDGSLPTVESKHNMAFFIPMLLKANEN